MMGLMIDKVLYEQGIYIDPRRLIKFDKQK